VCQSATSEARTARMAPPGLPARNTGVGSRPAHASWTNNAQTLGQLRADYRIPQATSGYLVILLVNNDGEKRFRLLRAVVESEL
jgi:hypothetical protein